MSKATQHAQLTALINKGNQMIILAKNACIYRASVAYIIQQVHCFLVNVKKKSSVTWSSEVFKAASDVQVLFNHFAAVLQHLSDDKWLQPALNWPADYVHKYIDGFRQSLTNLIPQFGLEIDVIKFDNQQELVNKISDLKNLKQSLRNVMAKIDTSDAVGVQQQIETKLAEIKRLLPQEIHRKSLMRHPSSDSMPIQQVQKRVEELLGQFKNINIPNEDIRVETQIGVGGFGSVYKATRYSTGEIVAVKELRKDRLTMSSWASLYAEVETMASVRHQYVLELVGAHITEPYRIITRYCPGKSLFNRIHRVESNTKQLTSFELTKIAYQVALGMSHLHSMNIVHRDLKTLNILLDENNNGLVADFGLSGIMKDNQELIGGVGTPHYTAPEVFMRARYGPKIDVYSYGIVLWEMLMRKVPFHGMSQAQIYEHVVTRGWRLPIPNDTPSGLKKLITQCWNKNPNDRPCFDDIIELFESGEIYFPGKNNTDNPTNEEYHKIKNARHCPPLNIDYVINTLNNTSDRHFHSVVHFIATNYDENIRKILREKGIMKRIVESDTNIDSILLLASVLLDGCEYRWFLSKGGLKMLTKCVETGKGTQMSSAVKFGLKVPKEHINDIKVYIPKVVEFLNQKSFGTSEHIIQFLTRFDQTDIKPFLPKISSVLVQISKDVKDQNTFNAISYLLKPCCDILTKDELYSFYHLLSEKFIVQPSFVETLIQVEDEEHRAELIYCILKATMKSDITKTFIAFLQKCLSCYRSVFTEVIRIPNLFSTLEELIQSGHDRGAFFLIFCISNIDEARKKLANNSLIPCILEMKDHVIQRLQIFTVLCMSEEFCKATKNMDGILRLLVFALSEQSYVNAAVRLIGAISSHETGVQVLTDNGVLEIFSQLFLSSLSSQMTTSHIILQNIAINGGDIPQVSLIVSCLMQDLINEREHRAEILETAIELVNTMPSCPQEHDLLKVILPQISVDEDPKIVYLSIKLISVSDPLKLTNFYSNVLRNICRVLQNPKFMYPEILEVSLNAIATIGEQYNINDFIKKIELSNFVESFVKLLDDKDATGMKIRQIINTISRGSILAVN